MTKTDFKAHLREPIGKAIPRKSLGYREGGQKSNLRHADDTQSVWKTRQGHPKKTAVIFVQVTGEEKNLVGPQERKKGQKRARRE